jgi:simple sugar transport system permease protein
MIAALLAAAAPLVLAGLAGLLTELAGALGVFLDGFMTLGSFLAWSLAKDSGSAALGCLATAAVCAALGWLLAAFVRKSGANPFLAGLAMNLAASGAVDVLSSLRYGTKGVLRDPAVAAAPAWFGLSPFAWLAAAALAAVAWTVARSRFGLRLRAAGAAPEVLAERGVDPGFYRAAAWSAAAALAALAGAALTFQVGAYAPGGVSGRGWIALAAVYLGFKRPAGVAAAALAFAAADLLAASAQAAAVLPATVLLGLPPALAALSFAAAAAFRRRRA